MLRIVEELEEEITRANLFVHACAFYELELLSEYSINTIKSILALTFEKMERDELAIQAYGVLKLLFTNNISLNEELAAQL